jgi:hypothetical protein
MPSNDEDADLQDALLRGGETGRREVEREEKKSTHRERERRNGHSSPGFDEARLEGFLYVESWAMNNL